MTRRAWMERAPRLRGRARTGPGIGGARSADTSDGVDGPARVEPSTWAAVATLAGTVLLLYTGVSTGEWRGAIVSVVQILAVGFVTWFMLRER